jgi:Cytochrome P460
MRVVLGNDLAIRAIADNHINPWPNGTMIGKVTWHEQREPSGVIVPGEFVQVEFMIRDSTKYRATAGWGWGRWIGTDLKPDGRTADFASTHCVDCHHAVQRNDYVFTMPINAQQGGASDYRPLGWSTPFDSLDRMLEAEFSYTNSTQS